MKRTIITIVIALLLGLGTILYFNGASWSGNEIIYKGTSIITQEQYNSLNLFKEETDYSIKSWEIGNIQDDSIPFTYDFVSDKIFPYLQSSKPNLWYLIRSTPTNDPLATTLITLVSIMVMMIVTVNRYKNKE
jgi:hypothetical protein